jgi:hypothetical protein
LTGASTPFIGAQASAVAKLMNFSLNESNTKKQHHCSAFNFVFNHGDDLIIVRIGEGHVEN